MSSRPITRRGPAGGRRVPGPGLAVLAAILLAGCSAGGSPSGSPAASPGVSSSVPPAAASAPVPATPGSTASPAPATAPPAPVTAPPATAVLPAEPPAARLEASAGTPVEGSLGSYTWGEAGSDAPWIVVRPSGAVTAPGPFAVRLDPAVPVATWSAAWAPITGREAGDVAGFAEGEGDAIAFAGPPRTGPWSLKLDVRFASGDQATYYWRLDASR